MPVTPIYRYICDSCGETSVEAMRVTPNDWAFVQVAIVDGDSRKRQEEYYLCPTCHQHKLRQVVGT